MTDPAAHEADPIFSDPRLARAYDPLDPDRSDLDAYLAIAVELGARAVVDIGCGTGTLACLLAATGVAVTGVDPAGASLDVARGKQHADAVDWVHGDAATCAALRPGLRADLATMTANVAQVFLTDEHLDETLGATLTLLRPGGHLVFETRRPEARAWETWTPASSHTELDIPGVGHVRTWDEVLAVDGELVTFRWSFDIDGELVTSTSTLRFMTEAKWREALRRNGFDVVEVRDAPDRPGRELVFVTQTAVAHGC